MSAAVDAVLGSFTFLLGGLAISLELFAVALVVSLVVGSLLGTAYYGSRRRWVRWPILAWVSMFRNTPLIVQLYIWYFGLPYVGLRLPSEIAGVLGLGLYGSSYMTEIVRSALASVGTEQEEAALALGLTYSDTIWRVLWPQAIPILLPPLTNEVVALFKNSSLLGFITVSELTIRTQEAISSTFASLPLYLTAGVMYLAVTGVLSVVLRVMERRTASSRGTGLGRLGDRVHIAHSGSA